MTFIESEMFYRMLSLLERVERLEAEEAPGEIGKMRAEAFICRTHIMARLVRDGLAINIKNSSTD